MSEIRQLYLLTIGDIWCIIVLKVVIKVKLFTTKEVAKMLKLSERTIKRKIESNEIKVIRVFGSVRISAEELKRLTGIEYKED